LSILINPKAPNFGANIGIFLGAFSVYFIILAVFILVYSKNAAKKITKSIEDISENAKDLERGEYDIEVSEGETLELDMLSTSMRHLGEELKEKSTIQKNEEEKRMLLISEISHDLKNPLAGVQGYSEMLLSGNVEESKKQDYLRMIYDNSVRSNNILQSLFTYSKLGSAGYEMSMELTDVSEYTRQIIAEYIPKLEEAGFKYSFSIPEEEIYIPMNRNLFRRIYDNLIENSVKYNVKGTEIRIEIRTSENTGETDNTDNISCRRLYINVSDNGIGIPEDHIDSIFMPFYRVEGKTGRAGSGGSGLGLAIVEKIVRLHGGTITYVPGDKKGCEFIMEFSYQT
jgi:signal transduction histidine kinase